MELPLDSDGFLRRECPECGREFKLEITEQEKTSNIVEKLYCPYCGSSAVLDQWFTHEQVEYLKGHAVSEVINPSFHKFTEDLRRATRSSKGLVRFEVNSKGLDTPAPGRLRERDDMTKVTFSCCSETIKILSNWRRELYCVLCGSKDTDSRLEE